MRVLWPCLLACSHPAAPIATPPAKACTAPEHRQFDFWVGDWDVTIHVRASPTSQSWSEAKGRQRIESILGGCAISETFSADGPGPPWAGRSLSSWQPAARKWRQAWVDDQGSYIALIGGIENGTMTLYGEPRVKDGTTHQMRMVFLDLEPASLRWEWQRSDDEWKTSVVMMKIDYARR